jgi:hypothetical protein
MKKTQVLKILRKNHGNYSVGDFVVSDKILNIYILPKLGKNINIIPIYNKFFGISHMSIFFYNIKNKHVYYIDPGYNCLDENLLKKIVEKTFWEINNIILIKSNAKYECVKICMDILLVITNNENK